MSGETPVLGLTIPDINDLIAAWPGIAAQGLLDLENAMILDKRNVAPLQDTYPIGLSMFGLTSEGATEEGWPSGSGMVITFRRKLADQAFQLKISQGISRSPQVYFRTGGTTFWSPWGRFGRETPWTTVSGTVTISDIANGTPKSTTVSFPSGAFTQAPVVTLGIQSTNAAAFQVACSTAPSTSGVTIQAARVISGTGSVVIHWHAIQGENL